MLRVVLLVGGIVWTAYFLARYISNERQHARRAREWGCQPPPREKGGWFGVKLIIEFVQAIRNERVAQFWIEWQERNPTTYVTRFFDTDIYQTTDPANIRAILATQFEDFSLGYRLQSWTPMFGKGIFTTDGAEWKHQRAMLRPQFAREIMLLHDTEERHHQNLLQHLAVRSDGWTDRVDMAPLFQRLTMDSSTQLLFGRSTDSQIAALRHGHKEGTTVDFSSFNDAYERGLYTVSIRNFLEEFHWFYNPGHYKDDCRVVHAYVDQFVQEGLRRADSTDTKTVNKYCFLDELIKETRDPIELRNYLMNILVAARDTTSSALAWAIYLLAHNVEVFHKLRQTILNDFGTHNSPKNLDFTSIKACTYLQHVLNETLRLYPPVPAGQKNTVRDTSLPVGGGPDGTSPVYIRKGKTVAWFVGAMHRRKDLWGADANEFRPDRWIGRKATWEYLPFNGGPRICLGQQQALALASFTIIRLLQKFDDIQAADNGERARHVTTLTDAPRYCWVKLHEAS